MKPRLFIGNLPPSVTQEELRDKFESLLSSHKNEAQVGEVQVRCKNENNYFGFVDIDIKDVEATPPSQPLTGMASIPLFLRKSIDLMNNTKWKGCLIKVQLAKESFIEKLRREQETQKEEMKKPDLNTEQGRNKKHADDILYKMNKSKERFSRANSHRKFPNSEADESHDQGDCGFEVVTRKNIPRNKVAPALEKRKRKSKGSSSDDDSDDEDEVRGGVPKFKGLLVNFPQAGKTEPKKQSAPLPIQNKLLSIASVAVPTPRIVKTEPLNESTPSGVNFKKNKQQRSDLLRLQSLEKLKELKAQRNNIIKSSLSTVTAVAPTTDQHKTIESDNIEEEPNNKRSKMTLFDEDDDDDDAEDSNAFGNSENEFTVKKQFEGKSGQKLLELKTRWGNDDRFKIDDRFKEDNGNDEDIVELVEHEKEKQLNILTDIIGKNVTSFSSGPATGKKNSVILARYDPEAETEEASDQESKKKGSSTRTKDKGLSKESSATSATPVPQLIRSTEPSTFKTVSNLKTLFSSGDNVTEQKSTAETKSEKSSFSLLATFGKEDDIDEEPHETSTLSGGVPRSFWQSNPFKYDSSDDEDEEKVKVKLDKAEKSSKPTLVIHGKHSFFFKPNDQRLQGVEDYFLKGDIVSEDAAETGVKKEVDFAEKRQELKSIVKAKIRNSKRKDEKRTLAIKRAIRLRKRKLQKGHRMNGYASRRTT
ncbi:Nucleolar protein 8 [Orchesella cincta]|uniref:Nucleolar protein 8 n=1 Tax=Orchesella cincta TaxID=48709 RepID=A0A1D2NE01_ORCCI|nr:Nucleolar protein 8 [Orchesella cincta]